MPVVAVAALVLAVVALLFLLMQRPAPAPIPSCCLRSSPRWRTPTRAWGVLEDHQRRKGVDPQLEATLRGLQAVDGGPGEAIRITAAESQTLTKAAAVERLGGATKVTGLPCGGRLDFTVRDDRITCANGQPLAIVSTPNAGQALDAHDLLMFHYTGAATSAAQTAQWLTNAEIRASLHVLIDRDGTLLQAVPLNRAAWHAGNGIRRTATPESTVGRRKPREPREHHECPPARPGGGRRGRFALADVPEAQVRVAIAVAKAIVTYYGILRTGRTLPRRARAQRGSGPSLPVRPRAARDIRQRDGVASVRDRHVVMR